MWTLSRGGSSGPRKTKHSLPLKKTFVSPSGNWRWLRKLRPADRRTSVPWRKPSDGRESVLSTLPSGSSFFTLVEAQENCRRPHQTCSPVSRTRRPWTARSIRPRWSCSCRLGNLTGRMPAGSNTSSPSSSPSLGARWQATLATAGRVTAPPLLFGLRLWAAVCLALYVAFWLELDNAYWAGTSAALVCQPRLGASLRKGWFRMIGTVVGAVAIVLLTAAFPQDRGPFLIGLALWGAGCALVATQLRNFASYAAALAGYTAAIIASDQLGATGGPNGQAFMLAITRVSEIWIGIACAGIVLAGTDRGGAPRRLAALLAGLSAEIASRFAATLARTGPAFAELQLLRRELLRRVITLDPTIDEA